LGVNSHPIAVHVVASQDITAFNAGCNGAGVRSLDLGFGKLSLN